jgi:hypothetical protein
MMTNELNWQERAQEAIYETIKDMSLEDELNYWQQETARMQAQQQELQNDPNVRALLIALIKNRSAGSSSATE